MIFRGKTKAIFGNGGHAREVITQIGKELIRFVDDKYWVGGDPKLLPLSKFDPKIYSLMIAIANPKDREDVVKKLPSSTEYFSFIHPTSKMFWKNSTLGKGSFVGANCIVTCDVKIGEHSILNRSIGVGHDCNIGNYFSAMPGSIISGNVTIGDRVYLGNNSSIKEKIKIVSDVIIGQQSCVIIDIIENGTYVGVPSKKI